MALMPPTGDASARIFREMDMAEHKFRVGQSVQFFPDPGVDRLSKGRYTIVRLLPLEGNTPQYRIKSTADGHERLVRESQLGTG